MRRIRLMKWVAVAATGTFFLWGAGGCLPQNFWSTFLGDTVVTGVGAAILAGALGQAGL